jgi:hypothetical protein
LAGGNAGYFFGGACAHGFGFSRSCGLARRFGLTSRTAAHRIALLANSFRRGFGRAFLLAHGRVTFTTLMRYPWPAETSAFSLGECRMLTAMLTALWFEVQNRAA